MQFTTDFTPWISFTDPSPSFTHGWECGEIFRDMELGVDISRNIHAANKFQIELMARKLGYKVDLQEIEGYDEWLIQYQIL